MEEQIQEQLEISGNNADLGFGGKLINIFVNPRRTFEALAVRPTYIWPMIIMILVTVIVTQLMFPVIMKSQMEMLRSNPNISPEQMQVIQQRISEGITTQRIITVVSQIIATPLIFYLFLSFIFYFIGSVIFGGDAKFKQVLSVFSWSSCIFILGAMVNLPLVLLKGTMKVSLSPALLLPADSVGTTLYTLLSKFDFFTIWFLAVFGLGFAFIYKFRLSKAYVAIGFLWGIWIAVSTIFANVFKSFGV